MKCFIFTTARLLTNLLKKNVPLLWDKACQGSFKRLKNALLLFFILALSTGHVDYMVYTDVEDKDYEVYLCKSGG